MSKKYHNLLTRQLKRNFGDLDSIPEKLLEFLDEINLAYEQADQDRNMLERSLDLSSEELLNANAELLNHRKRLELLVQERTNELERANLQLKSEVKERARSQQILNTLYQITQAGHEVTGLKDLLHAIRGILASFMDTSNFFVALYEKKTETITLPYFIDSHDKFEKFPIAKTLTGYVIKSKKPLLVDKEQINKMVKDGIIEIVGTPAEIWLGSPIIYNEAVVGVIAVQHYEDKNAIGIPELELIKFISNQVGILIERKIAEEEINNYSKQLEELNASKDKFFSVLAHDLRSPFIALLGYTEILNEELDELDTEQLKFYASNLNKAAQNLFNLLENLLEWSCVQSNKINLNPQKFDLIALIKSVINLFSENLRRKQIELKTDFEKELIVFSDINMIESVTRNFVSNAIKFTKHNGDIRIFAKRIDNKVEVVVEDNGIGIPEDKLKVLFKLDETSSSPGTDNEQGTGLGLIISKDFIEKNGGELRVESEEGKGSKFSFTLPLSD